MSPELSRLQQLTYAICMPVCSAAFANRECRDDMSLRTTPLAPFQPPNKQYFITEFSRGEQPFDFRCDAICNAIAGSNDYHHPLNVRKLKEVFKSQFPGACPTGIPILIPDTVAEPSGEKVKVDVTSGASRRFIQPEVIYYPGTYPVLARMNVLIIGFTEMVHRNEKVIFQTIQTGCCLLLGAALFYLGVRGQMQPNVQVAGVESSTQA